METNAETVSYSTEKSVVSELTDASISALGCVRDLRKLAGASEMQSGRVLNARGSDSVAKRCEFADRAATFSVDQARVLHPEHCFSTGIRNSVS